MNKRPAFGRGIIALAVLLGSLVSTSVLALPDFTALAKRNGPAVVNISTSQTVSRPSTPEMEIPELPEGHPFGELFKRFFGEGGPGSEQQTESLGSGFIISADGYVLSNHHVVAEADEVLVKLHDRRVLQAEVIGSDPQSDLALLKVNASDLPVVEIGDSRDLEVGEWVLAIGSPFGFEQSVTAGIVSAKGRSLPRENYVPFIQTDVAINPGNSGGPLFNMDGKVIGINSQIYSRTGGYMGLSFAIPIGMAMNVVEQLKTSGKVSRGWLGVLIQEVTRELAESFGMDKPQGALVAKIFPDSPAAAAGFEVGDVIVRFNEQSVETSSALPPLVGVTGVGKSVPVEVLRGSEPVTLEVTIGELPQEPLASATGQVEPDNALGITVADLSAEDKQQLEVDHGIRVTSVKPDSVAQAAGIREGDVILMLDGKDIANQDEFTDMVTKLPEGKSVPVLIQRDRGPVFLALKIAE